MIYCDYNATAPLRAEARDAMIDAMAYQANASSVHGSGRTARKIIETAREKITNAIGSRHEDLIFTSGGTEANALAIHGAMRKLENAILVYSDLEHPAVRDIARSGQYRSICIGVTSEGQIDLEDLKDKLSGLSDMTPFLTLLLANNETGVIQPVAEASAIIRAHSGYTHCDAVQAVGKIPVNVSLLGVDYLALSAHKCGGPQGSGALWLRPGAPLKPIQIGGGQERFLRSGTENLIGIVGFGAAVEASIKHLSDNTIASIRDAFEKLVSDVPGISFFGRKKDRLPGTSAIALEGFKGETQVMAMDLAGYAVSSGSACSSGKVHTSAVLQSMGASEALASSALRVSFGWASTPEDANGLAKAWIAAARRAVPEYFKEIA